MMKSRKRMFRLAIGLTAVVLAVSACSSGGGDTAGGGTASDVPTDGPLAELIDAAKAEGKVVYYTSEVDAINEAVAKAFTDKYGIEVEMLRLASGPLAVRFAEEQGAGGSQADVLRTADGAAFVNNPEWFEELTPELVPELAEYPDYAFLDNKRSVLTQYNTFMINYNNTLIKEGDLPKTWEDILDPKWKGHIVFSDPRASTSWLGWAGAMVEAHGIEYLEDLAKQDLEIIDSAAPGAQQVAAGAYWMSLPAYSGHATPVIQQGAPVSSIQPTDPEPLKRDHIGIVEGAAHPNAARLFLDFRLSPDVLEMTCGLNEIGVPLPDIPGCVEVPENPVTAKDVWTPEEMKPILDALGLPQT